jgi:dGTP triphosphohydrolase
VRARTISEKACERLRKEAAKRRVEPDYAPEITAESAIVLLANELEERYAKPARLRDRKANLKDWTSKTIKALKNGCKIIPSDTKATSVRYRHKFEVPLKAQALAAVLKATANLLIFSDPRVTTLEAKGHHIINTLFDKFNSKPELMPLDFQELIKDGRFGSQERLVSDFIAGMTDRYAYAYYKRLFHPGTGSFYEDV